MSIARFHFMNILSENLSKAQVFGVFFRSLSLYFCRNFHSITNLKKKLFFYGQKFLYKFKEKESCKE